MQFVITAHDYKDEDALNRRLACRASHLDGLREMSREGKFLSGGAILNENGKMIGSNAHFSFADRAELDAWLETEPYMTGRVWEEVRVCEVRLFDPEA
jgi:uncharacterized protein YciI